jgi:hypothetical protein
VKISKEHRDALNEALDETAGYEGDVYVFDVKHIEILRSAVIAMLEDDEQIATVAPAVDAQPVAWRHKATKILRNDSIAKGADFEPDDWEPLYASPQSEGLRKDAWQPIETAPEGKLLVVAWLDKDDPDNPERHAFDFIEDDGWVRHNEDYDRFLYVATLGSTGPSAHAPYTHWIELPEVPAALSQQDPQ